MNPVRELVNKLGGIVKAAEHFGVGKSTIGDCCTSGTVYSLELALAMAREAARSDEDGAVDVLKMIDWLESVSPKRRSA